MLPAKCWSCVAAWLHMTCVPHADHRAVLSPHALTDAGPDTAAIKAAAVAAGIRGHTLSFTVKGVDYPVEAARLWAGVVKAGGAQAVSMSVPAAVPTLQAFPPPGLHLVFAACACDVQRCTCALSVS
jgi:hypothetical protein